jgi:multidrug resistance efflux pump
MNTMHGALSTSLRILLTGVVVLIAAGAVAYKYWDYVVNPWTRDGQVRAQVIQITPRVSGPIVNLPIEDNQLVKKGDLLFEIDPRTFAAAVEKSKGDLAKARAEFDDAKDKAERARRTSKQDSGAVSKQRVIQRVNEQRAAKATLLSVGGAHKQVELNLEFTKVLAPVEGYVTNLNLRLGDQAVANRAALALVDIDSFWIDGFFRENYVGDIAKGDRAIVTLMTYPNQPIEGQVDSVGWGIAQDDGSTGEDLLPKIRASFEWIRLAQRVPVRIHVDKLPEGVELRVGTTASVVIMTGTAGGDSTKPVAAVPRPLQ